MLPDLIRRGAKTAFAVRGLLIKACIFSIGWLVFPFWAFLIISLYFYLVPLFQPFKLFVPFILTLLAAAILPYGFWFAVLLGILFFLLFGIKNLILVNRFDNHQLIVFLILFLMFFGFFWHFENWQRWTVSLISFGIGFFFFFLFKELASYSQGSSESKKIIVSVLGSFLLWQAAMVILFLPLNYFYQTALLFLSSVILTDILLEYLGGVIGRRKILADFSIFFVIAVVILTSANWGL